MKILLTNGKVYVEKGVYAQAVLVEDGIIRYVGDNDTAKQMAGQADKQIDLGGKTVIPGLNDNHDHPMTAADYNRMLDLSGCKSLAELVARGKAYAQDPEHAGKPIMGTGWNENLFTEGPMKPPTVVEADMISTEVPVVLIDYTEHVAVGNHKVMEMAGVGEVVPEVQGGVILLGEDGKPNGHFQENARHVIMDQIPDCSTEELEKYLDEFLKYCTTVGLTSVNANDVGLIRTPEEVYRILHHFQEDGRFPVRYHTQNYFMTIPEMEEYWNGERANGKYDDILTPGPLKLFKDGALGSRTAYMFTEYVDDPGNFGESVETQEQLFAQCKWANDHGWQVITHAIGDHAIRDIADAYVYAMGDKGNVCRNIVNHCQMMTPDLTDYLAANGLLAAVQPIFLHSDLHSLETRVTEEFAHTSNNYKTQIAKMGHVSFGTDCPVEDINPWRSIYSAVVRKDQDGYPENGYFADECIDVETAIDCYTYETAYQQFFEDKKGRIKAGYYADLAVLDTDCFTCDPMELKNIKSVLTMMDGKIVYEA